MKQQTIMWLVLATFFIVLGLVFLSATLRVVSISDTEYLALMETNNLTAGAVSASSQSFAQAGSVGFIVVGFCCLTFALVSFREKSLA